MLHRAKTFLATVFRIGAVTLLFLLMGAAWVWRLHPGPAVTDPSVAERGRLLESLTPVLVHAPEDFRLSAMTSLAWLPDETLAAISEWRFEPPDRQIRLLTVQKGPVESGPLHAGLLFSVLQTSNAHSLEGTHLMIAAAGERLPDSLKIEALKILAAKAFGAQKPVEAVEILDRAVRLASGRWEIVTHAVEACRQARRPDLALRVVQSRLEDESHPLDAEHHQEAMAMETHLMLQSGQARDALSHALEDTKKLKGRSLAGAFERLALAASHAGLSVEAIAPFDAWLDSFAFHKLNPVELIHLKGDRSGYLRALELHARLSDEAGDARRARDSLLRLAALGDMRFADRMADLCAEEPRDGGWNELRAELKDACVAGTKAADFGQWKVAVDLFALHLERHPDHRDAAFELAAIRGRQANTAAERVRVWDSFVRDHLGDAPGVKALASALEDAGQPQVAFRTLGTLADEDRDEAVLTNMHRVALVLGDFDGALAALNALVESKANSTPADFLELARLQRSATQGAASNSALLAGLKKHPGNALLQEELSHATGVQVRPAKAAFAVEAE